MENETKFRYPIGLYVVLVDSKEVDNICYPSGTLFSIHLHWHIDNTAWYGIGHYKEPRIVFAVRENEITQARPCKNPGDYFETLQEFFQRDDRYSEDTMSESGFGGIKDSGQREEFDTGSVRDTSEGKPRYDLISPIALHRLAMHVAAGAKKYGDRNWEKGQPLQRYIESLERHLQKMKMGATDEDHEAAVMWNIMAFIHTKKMIKSGVLSNDLDNLPMYPSVVIDEIVGE